MAGSWTPYGRKGAPFVIAVPDGDERERLTCPDCGYIAYENPKLVVGAVVFHGERLLLCRRAIAPREGFWTMPAGFLELDETTAEGAVRETWEEACARIRIDRLLGIYELPGIGQIYMIYRATMTSPDYAPGPESREVGLFSWDEVPWDALAFPSVRWALDLCRDGAPDGPAMTVARLGGLPDTRAT